MEWLIGRDGHVVDRPVQPGGHGSFPLHYVRTGPRGRLPVLVVPGGPGLASFLPYRGFRRAAVRRGLDVLMVEHRGVGLSRRDHGGRDLPVEAVTVANVVDDLAAVLDHAGVAQAVVYGSSYGTYLAQGFGVRHPARVAAMVLDSPILGVEGDLALNRAFRRRAFWDGGTPATRRVAEAVRNLIRAGVPAAEVGHVVQVAHEFAGPEALLRLLQARARGRAGRLWRGLARLGVEEVEGTGVPYLMEPDLVRDIAFRELGFGLPADGLPLDPQASLTGGGSWPAFKAEPFDLASALPGFDWPVVVLSGERDLRTPRPVAQRIVDLAPHGVLVPLADTGHSALDAHQRAAILVAGATVAGTTDRLPGLAPRIASLPRRGASRWLGVGIAAAVRAATLR
ncbi:alpha/beta hydrolase [Kineococcus gynurae]|uniref:Alpha/beta hydrolase n=1 Tax=Kineococcus gynurae TaxID=452979 RepID=A0ABV5LUN9_9ACTN